MWASVEGPQPLAQLVLVLFVVAVSNSPGVQWAAYAGVDPMRPICGPPHTAAPTPAATPALSAFRREILDAVAVSAVSPLALIAGLSDHQTRS